MSWIQPQVRVNGLGLTITTDLNTFPEACSLVCPVQPNSTGAHLVTNNSKRCISKDLLPIYPTSLNKTQYLRVASSVHQSAACPLAARSATTKLEEIPDEQDWECGRATRQSPQMLCLDFCLLLYYSESQAQHCPSSSRPFEESLQVCLYLNTKILKIFFSVGHPKTCIY